MLLSKKIFLLLFVVLPAFIVAQPGSDSAFISFSSTVANFGMKYEADGAFFVDFTFENQGKTPLFINKIYSPGIEVVEYPNGPVTHGKTATLRFKVSPFGLAGNYNKIVQVFTSAANSPSALNINGKIVSGTYSKNFRHTLGPLDFKQSQVNFGYLYKGDKAERFLLVRNNSAKVVQLSFGQTPQFIQIRPAEITLDAFSENTIEVKFDTEGCDEWDFFIHRVKLNITSDTNISDWLAITANIREDFSHLTGNEQVLKTPVASMPVQVFNFDTINAGEVVSCNFKVFNYGDADLIIRAVKPTCGCTAALPSKSIVPPGSWSDILVEFNSDGFTGLNKKGVTVITNDPQNYKQFLYITGYVR
ncbi:MAG: DUF1573 domain-containing protein [Bacteroidales bacterium]|nr:DUF1573 domain-containing protein [Bacteroidales bacterium]